MHRATWPSAAEVAAGGDPVVLETSAEVLRAIRKAKSEAKLSMRAGVSLVTVAGARAAAIEPALGDLAAAGHAARIELRADAAQFAGVTPGARGGAQPGALETAAGSGLYVAAQF